MARHLPLCAGYVCHHEVMMSYLNPKTSSLIQRRHPYTGNLNSEMPGDSEIVFLRW